MIKEESYLSKLTATAIVVILIVILYAIFNFFTGNVFASALISVIIVVLLVFYMFGPPLVGGMILGLIAAGFVVGILSWSIGVTVIFIVGICILFIGWMMLKQ